MEGPRYACLTGVKEKEKKETYKKYLCHLGYSYSDTQASLLVVGSVLTEKFKVYNHHKNVISCVKCEWLEDSYKVGKELLIGPYTCFDLLYGSKIGICGFDEDIANKIKSMISEKGGEFVELDFQTTQVEIRLINEPSLQLLIIPKYLFCKLRVYENGEPIQPTFPCVDLKWLESSIKTGQCRYPLDYSFNYLEIKPNRREKEIGKMKMEKERLLEFPLISKEKLMNRVGKVNESFSERSISNSLSSKADEKIEQKAKKVIKPILISKFDNHTESTAIRNCEINEDNFSFNQKLFEEQIIYFHSSIENYQVLVCELLKPLICIKGGIYIETMSPLATHIIVDELSYNEYIQLLKFGDNIPILRVEWIIDSILINNGSAMMFEEDYRIRSFSGEKLPTNEVNLSKIYSEFQPSNNIFARDSSSKGQIFNFSSKSISSNILVKNMSSNSTLSISVPTLEEPCLVKKKLTFKSAIFKNIQFFIPAKFRKEKELKNIVTIIRENGGIAYDKPKNNKLMYCLMLDGIEMESTWEEISKEYQEFLRPVSIRWVKYCVKKDVFIESNESNYFIFKPFKFQTPIVGFFVCKFEILGVNDVLKLRIKELLDELGSKKSKPSFTEITHCLCSTSENNSLDVKKKMNEVIMEIKNVNAKAKFIKLQWIFDCVANGQMLPIEEYRFE